MNDYKLFHQLYYGWCGLTSSLLSIIILKHKRCHTILLQFDCVPWPKQSKCLDFPPIPEFFEFYILIKCHNKYVNILVFLVYFCFVSFYRNLDNSLKNLFKKRHALRIMSFFKALFSGKDFVLRKGWQVLMFSC